SSPFPFLQSHRRGCLAVGKAGLGDTVHTVYCRSSRLCMNVRVLYYLCTFLPKSCYALPVCTFTFTMNGIFPHPSYITLPSSIINTLPFPPLLSFPFPFPLYLQYIQIYPHSIQSPNIPFIFIYLYIYLYCVRTHLIRVF